ncbi:MAG: hypothetical protein ACYC3O_11970 [Burkholderiales bacterium]
MKNIPLSRTRTKAEKVQSLGALLALCTFTCSSTAHAHAVIGERVFPATLSFDDPGIQNEFSLNWEQTKLPNGNGSNTSTNTYNLALSKTLVEGLTLNYATSYLQLSPPAGPMADGYNYSSIGLGYQLYGNAAHEFLLATNINVQIANTGSSTLGNAAYDTISPELVWGKGFGDLPWSLRYLRPLAITGAINPQLPTAPSIPETLNWAFSMQYSISYLQDYVRYLGIPEPLSNLIPIIELPMTSTQYKSIGWQTTGTINPGFIWVGNYGQIGLTAQIPVSRNSGSSVGVMLGVDFYIDDIFPHTLGRPLF